MRGLDVFAQQTNEIEPRNVDSHKVLLFLGEVVRLAKECAHLVRLVSFDELGDRLARVLEESGDVEEVGCLEDLQAFLCRDVEECLLVVGQSEPLALASHWIYVDDWIGMI